MPKAILTISSKNYSSWSLRGWLLCRMAGLEFEEEQVDLGDPSMRQELLLLSPSVLVPRLSHDGVAVWDTLAIAEYLAEIAPDAGLLPTDRVARAGVIRLMKNPHFIELRKELETLQSEATSAKTKLKWATEAYDNKVKHFENNIDFLSRRVRELEQENAELRARLGMEARHEKRVEFGNPDGIIRIPEDTLS